MAVSSTVAGWAVLQPYPTRATPTCGSPPPHTGADAALPTPLPSPTIGHAAHGRGAPRKRYPAEAYSILSDFFYRVDKYPTREQRKQLVEQIRRVPNCEDYSMDKLQVYFSGKRQTHRHTTDEHLAPPPRGTRKSKKSATDTIPTALTSSASILYPSLVKDAIILPMLEVLLAEEPNPSHELAAIWADRVGHDIQTGDILTYARLRTVNRGTNSVSPPNSSSPQPRTCLPRARKSSKSPPQLGLPTPTTSKSPEPSSTLTSPVWRRESGAREEVKDELLSDDDMDIGPTPYETAFRSSASPATHLPRGSMRDLACMISKSLERPPTPENPPPEAPPKTFAQLAAWTQAQNKANQALLDNISKGNYARLGLTSAGPPSRE